MMFYGLVRMRIILEAGESHVKNAMKNIKKTA
jgi:hypothetical protein